MVITNLQLEKQLELRIYKMYFSVNIPQEAVPAQESCVHCLPTLENHSAQTTAAKGRTYVTITQSTLPITLYR